MTDETGDGRHDAEKEDTDSELREARALARHLDRLVDGEPLPDDARLAEDERVEAEIARDIETLDMLDTLMFGDEEPHLTSLGDFRVIQEIGRGGMGIVYLARQLSLDRRVALKVMPVGVLADKNAVARFHREAQVTAGLHHSNIVEVYSMGVEGGTPYYAMEFCEGETLQQVLQRLRAAGAAAVPRAKPPSSDTPVTPCAADPIHDTKDRTRILPDTSNEEAARVRSLGLPPGGLPDREACRRLVEAFVGAAKGLHHAHTRGVIHRDLKPSNLMLDGDGQLRVLDFGLAFLEGAGRLTQSRERLGTPLYMSPEQAHPDSGVIGPPTDVYGLGATLYESLTLSPPFDGRVYEETLHQIEHKDPLPPRRLNRHVPKDLQTIVLKCLRKRSADRYPSAEALAEDLSNFLRGEPIKARPVPLLERAVLRLWRSRRKLLEGAIVMALVLILSLLGVQRAREANQRRLDKYKDDVLWAVMAMLRKPLLATEGKRAEATLQRVSLPSSGGDLDLRFTRREAAYEGWLEAASEVLEAGLSLADAGTDPVEEAIDRLRAATRSVPGEPVAYYHLARGLRLLRRPREAEKEVDRALRYQPDFVPALAFRASLLEQMGSPAANAARELALKSGQAQGAWAEAWLCAHRAVQEKRWMAAADAYEDLLGAQKGRVEPYLGCWLETRLGQGLALLEAGDLERALVEFSAGRERAQESMEPTLLLAKTFYLKGRPLDAAEFFDELYSRVPAGAVDDAARAIAAAYREVGDTQSALMWIEKVQDHAARLFLKAELLREGNHAAEAAAAAREAVKLGPRMAAAHLALANALVELGEPRNAIVEYQRAAEFDPGDVRPWLGLAAAFQAQDALDLALKAAADAVAIDPGSVDAHLARARVLSRQGRLNEAAGGYREALDLAPDHALAHSNLGTVLDRQGLPSQAIEHYRNAVSLRPELAFVHYNLALALHRQKDLLGAAEAYRQALRLGLDDITLRSNLAFCLHRAGKLEEAKREYEAALEWTPNSALLHHSLAVLHEQRDETQLAREQHETTVELEPDWPDAHNDLGFVLDELGFHEQALAQYREAFTLDPGSIWAQNNQANLLLRIRTPDPEQEFLAGEIRRLEDATRLANADAAVATLRDRYRQAFLPDLASYDSVDWRVEAASTLVANEGPWRYFRGVQAPPADLSWTKVGFDDSGWEEGEGSFGSAPGEGIRTVLDAMQASCSTVYLRGRFLVADPASLRRLTLVLRIADGCVAYLNGSEAGRMRAGPPETAVAFDAAADDSEDQPWVDRRMEIDPRLLQPGVNVLAVHALWRRKEGNRFHCAVNLKGVYAFDGGGRERALEALASYRAAPPAGPGAASRIAYFEGRLLQEGGDLDAAERKFREVLSRDVSRPEPWLRLAECLHARGNLAGAGEILRTAIASGLERSDALWDAWMMMSLVEEARSPGELLAGMPQVSVQPRDHAKDIIWLLERLAAGEPLRIRCGGQGLVLEGKGSWSRDRFFRSGTMYQLPKMEALPRGSGEFALYTTERFFTEPTGNVGGYSIPLPRGRYRVTLRFAEGHFTVPGSRVFDVLLEGETVLAEYEPLRNGFGFPDARTFPVDVMDGVLNIDFRVRIENPKISAFEVSRE